MPSYCVFLGHQPFISLAELTVLLPDTEVVRQWNRQIVTLETGMKLDEAWLRNVGGTVLIAEELKCPDAPLAEIIPSLLFDQLKQMKTRKAAFSFRCFGVPRSDIRQLYRSCKQYLKSRKIPSRYIGNERNPAKPGTLLLRGIPGPNSCELVILQDERKGKKGGDATGQKGLRHEPERNRAESARAAGSRATGSGWIGKTIAVQDIKAYTERDMGKPFRDTRTGLMPPKLAQVMLNLALMLLSNPNPNPNPKSARESGSGPGPETWSTITVWDPFCGSGVIALEALSRHASVLASDRTERAVQGCLRNIKWLRDREKTPKGVIHRAWKQNALKVTAEDLSGPALHRSPSTALGIHSATGAGPTVIVTETSLGPSLKKPPTKTEIGKLVSEAEALEIGFFSNLAKLSLAVPIVCTFPVYIARDGSKHFLPKVLQKIEKLGYRLTCVNNPHVQLTSRHTLLYLRPDQHVGREIVCFLPPKQRLPYS